MNKRVADLIAELNSELESLKQLNNDLMDTWESMPEEGRLKEIYKAALALKLHNFYTGIEKIFEMIADDINGGIPVSREWHKRLLHSMTLEVKGIRSQVISKSTEKMLSEYLAFRHIVRNIYAFELDTERLTLLIKHFPATFDALEKDLVSFIDFLEQEV